MSSIMKQSKKMVLFNVLDILKKYTDENHRLSQKEIEEILCAEYAMTVDRKTIKTSLMNLMDFGYDIEYSESIRSIRNRTTGEAEESLIMSDFYLRRNIEDSELRLLIDSLLFNRHLPYKQCKDLIEKLESLSSIHFKTRIKHVGMLTHDRTENQQLFWTIDVIDEAIIRNRKVMFKYVEYDMDLKQIPVTDSDGNARIYTVSPYQMAVKDGVYYLICNNDHSDCISNYRVDRITDIELADERIRPFESLKGSNGRGLDLEKYLNANAYMYSSNTIRVKLRITTDMVGDVIETFGKELRFFDREDGFVTVIIYANEESVLRYAKSNAPDVVILGPNNLRDQMKAAFNKGIDAYAS